VFIGASSTTSEAEIDMRLKEALDMEGPDILIDLRHQNTNGNDKYEIFWQKFLRCVQKELQFFLRLQFCPKNPRTKAASQFREGLPIKIIIQKQQFHQEHIDSHYCAAIYRGLREHAVMIRDMSVFVCMDDKHRIKVGEPGVPVATAERGRRVLVSLSKYVIMILLNLV